MLDRARRELAQYYPTYADFEPLKKDQIAYEHQPMRLVPLKDDGTPDIDSLNAEFTGNTGRQAQPALGRQADRRLPLGADGQVQELPSDRPLLKTRWLCKKDEQARAADDGAERRPHRRRLRHRRRVPNKGGNTAQKTRARQANRPRHDESQPEPSARAAARS